MKVNAIVRLMCGVMVSCGFEQGFEDEPTERRTRSASIVGGAEVEIADVPWQVALMSNSFEQSCGGSILSADWVVSAAHCEPAVGSLVGAGATKLSELRTRGQVRRVSQVLKYPGFQDAEQGRDLALIKLDQPLDLTTPDVQAIAYATDSDAWAYAPGQPGFVSGWGSLKTNGQYPDALQRVEVAVANESQVRSAFGTIPNDQFGAGGDGRDSCDGDSGGPLVVQRSTGPLLVGIVSWGDEQCGKRNTPGIYSRVASFSSWIQSSTGLGGSPPTMPPNTGNGTLLRESPLAARRDETFRRVLTLPPNAKRLVITISGGSGDADLYVRYGEPTSRSKFDCAPYVDGNSERCTLKNPRGGAWHIGVRGFEDFADVTLVATIQ
jgi:secreted trypsin-like serine protease